MKFRLGLRSSRSPAAGVPDACAPDPRGTFIVLGGCKPMEHSGHACESRSDCHHVLTSLLGVRQIVQTTLPLSLISRSCYGPSDYVSRAPHGLFGHVQKTLKRDKPFTSVDLRGVVALIQPLFDLPLSRKHLELSEAE